MRWLPRRHSIVLCALLLTSTGCATVALRRGTVGNAVDEAVVALASDENRAIIADLLADPQLQKAASGWTQDTLVAALQDPKVKAATKELGAAATEGALEGINTPAQHEKLQAHAKALANAIVDALNARLNGDLGTSFNRLVENAANRAVNAILSEGNRANADRFIEKSISYSVDTLMTQWKTKADPVIKNTIEQTIVASFSQAFRESLGPTLHAWIHNERKLLFSDITDQRDSIFAKLDEVGREAERKLAYALSAAAFFLLCTGAAGAAFLVERRRMARERHRAERRERGLKLVAGAIKTHHHDPAVQQILNTIKEDGAKQVNVDVEKDLKEFLEAEGLAVKRKTQSP